MAEVTAALVKELREKSGAGMMDCKKALQETSGDMDAAQDWLRTKGLSKAAKKADRAAAEGLVAGLVSGDGKSGVLIELNAETDFVSKNDKFQQAARHIAATALEGKANVLGYGHYHVWVDAPDMPTSLANLVLMPGTNAFTLDLSAWGEGEHTIRIEPAHNDHAMYTPATPVTFTVTVSAAAPDASPDSTP